MKADTEGTFELIFTRTPGYLWAQLFRVLHVHPIAVTLISIVLGAASAFFFVRHDLVSNIIAVALLVVANWFDCADGQLARMTGKKTLVGRILDGFAGDVWFQFIYVALAIRLTPTWGIWGWLLGAYAGYWCHIRQANLADYYRNLHLFFQLGPARSELDRSLLSPTSAGSVGNLSPTSAGSVGGVFAATPSAPAAPSPSPSLREAFLRRSRPMMPACQALTFDLRIAVLYLTALLDIVWVYFLFEAIVLQIIFFRLRSRHEQLCADITTQYLTPSTAPDASPSDSIPSQS